MVTADIENSSLWQEVFSINVEAERPYPGRYIPIKEILIPLLIEHPVVAVRVTTNIVTNLRSAGWLAKYISAGTTVGGKHNHKTDYSRRLFLDKPSIIQWLGFGESYKVIFHPYSKLTQITFRIWEFTGEFLEPDSEQIEALRIDLLRVEKTIQFVASRDVPTVYDVTIE